MIRTPLRQKRPQLQPTGVRTRTSAPTVGTSEPMTRGCSTPLEILCPLPSPGRPHATSLPCSFVTARSIPFPNPSAEWKTGMLTSRAKSSSAFNPRCGPRKVVRSPPFALLQGRREVHVLLPRPPRRRRGRGGGRTEGRGGHLLPLRLAYFGPDSSLLNFFF